MPECICLLAGPYFDANSSLIRPTPYRSLFLRAVLDLRPSLLSLSSESPYQRAKGIQG
jgi:hypothetical protein